MSNFSPDTDDMDMQNEMNQIIKRDGELLYEAFRMMDENDTIGRLYLPTREHVRVLVNKIKSLEDQLKLSELYENGDSPI